jgi:hypothetical protein
MVVLISGSPVDGRSRTRVRAGKRCELTLAGPGNGSLTDPCRRSQVDGGFAFDDDDDDTSPLRVVSITESPTQSAGSAGR